MISEIKFTTQVILTRIVVLPAIGLGLTTAFKHLGLLPDDPVRFQSQEVPYDTHRASACFIDKAY